MVARRFHKANSSSSSLPSGTFPPPPPYKEKLTSPPLIVAETTTTTTTEIVTTTTQTTTHIFPLPHWKKRGNSDFSPVLPSTGESGRPDNGMVLPRTSSTPFLVDKDLPPIPVDLVDCASLDQPGLEEPNFRRNEFKGNENSIPTDIKDISRSSIPYSSRKSLDTPSLPRSQTALAHAALGLGLPHVMPLASSSSSEVNTVAFLTSPPPLPRRSIPNLRRSKSSQKLNADSSPDRRPGVDKATFAFRRTRGLSLGANFRHEPKGKEKEKVPDENKPDESSPKLLVRRPSFWSRKKAGFSADMPPSPTSNNHLSSIPPSDAKSSSRANFPMPPSPGQRFPVQHPRGLSRSHSERSRSRKASMSTSRDPDAPQTRLRRPSTSESPRAHPRSWFGMPSLPIASSPSKPPPSQPIREHRHSDLPARPTRPRALTTPPFLHRLSVNFLPPSIPSSTETSSAFANSRSTSPSILSASPLRPTLGKSPVDLLRPQSSEESPDVYVDRLLGVVSKAEITSVLASSGDTFLVRALQSYIDKFDFLNDPLDVALRKLLMDVSLPRETQQIDRVIEAFAIRYLRCNPSLFISDDHPYILAFSLIMLHTDAFNKSNKRKMTKADYIKNTRLPGVAPEVLDYFYDNVVFAPFIFIEDPLDVNGQRGLLPESRSARPLSTFTSPTSRGNNTTILGKGSKVDPYFLITQNMLDPLRVNVESFVPLRNPYQYEGTAGSWDSEELQRVFAKASIIEVGAVDGQRSPLFTLNISSAPNPPTGASRPFPGVLSATGEVWTLKVAKAGVLNRKDDVLGGGKKANNRKWKPWSIVLTGSQLLLFRDSSWATNLLGRCETPNGHVIFPEASLFKPDELLSVKDSIAVFDNTYTKHKNTLRFVMPNGHQILLQSQNEIELNEWISRINYASAFKSAGVRMRSLAMSSKDVELTGVAAATSHLHDMQYQDLSSGSVRTWGGDAAKDLMDMLSGGFPSVPKNSPTRRITMVANQDVVDLEVPSGPEVEMEGFKTTFDRVKADLAAGRRFEEPLKSMTVDHVSNFESTSSSPVSPSEWSDDPGLGSRSDVIRSKVRDIEMEIHRTQTQLDSDLCFARNIATLTPFQKSTRDRLENAIRNVAKRISQVRLEMTKLACHRDVLSNDIKAAERDWRRAKNLALKVATQTLQSQGDGVIPQMTLSFHESADQSLPLQPTSRAAERRRSESSICESFHSALDFGLDGPSQSDDLGLCGFLSASVFESTRSSSSSSASVPMVDSGTSASTNAVAQSEPSPVSISPSVQDCEEGGSHERFYTAPEEAEEWNKTRCARRVSLVRLPSAFRMSTLLEKHAFREGDGDG